MTTALKIAGRPAVLHQIRNGRKNVLSDYWYICEIDCDAPQEEISKAMCERLGCTPQTRKEWNRTKKDGWAAMKQFAKGYQEIKKNKQGLWRFVAMRPAC